MKTSSGSVIQSLAEMQTSALNLHQKTAGGYIRPFAATTGTITIPPYCRPPPSTFTRRRRAGIFSPSPPKEVQSPDVGETIRIPSYSRHLARSVGIMNDICQIRIDFLFWSGFITDPTLEIGQVKKGK
jgi:hypothetical protein